MEMWLNVCFCYVICLNNEKVLGAVRLPEDLMPYDNHNSVCYGPGTHGQFRPSCPNPDFVIAIESLNVGAKTLATNCPSSVTKLTNHTGSYLVDQMNISKLLDESSCCFPDEANDCISKYNYEHSGLDYFYHKSSSGYTQSKPNMEVSWQKTTCNDTSEYPSGSNYMFMKYYCIERFRIGNMCSNKTYNTTNGAFYLTNTDYPNSVASSIDFCQCYVQTKGTNIQVLTIDGRFEKEDNECKQGINVSDSEGVNTWDCESDTNFDITKMLKNKEVTVTFKNNLQENGGHFWVGFNAEGVQSEIITIDCSFLTKKVTTMATSTSVLYTSTLQFTDVPSTIHPSTTQNTERPTTIPSSTLQNTESLLTIHTSTLHKSESTLTIHTSTLQNTENPSTIHIATLQNPESISTIHPSTLKNTESPSTVYPSTLKNSKSTSNIRPSTLQNTESTSTIHSTTLQNNKGPSTIHTSTLQNIESTSNIHTSSLQTGKRISFVHTSTIQSTSIKMFPILQSTETTQIGYKSLLETSESWSTMHTTASYTTESTSTLHTNTLKSGKMTPLLRTISLESNTIEGTSEIYSTVHISKTSSTSLSISGQNTFSQTSAFSVTPSDTTLPSESTALIRSTSDMHHSSTKSNPTSTSSTGLFVINQSIVYKAPGYITPVAILCSTLVFIVIIIIICIRKRIFPRSLQMQGYCRNICKERRVHTESDIELQGNTHVINHRNISKNHINLHRPHYVNIVNKPNDNEEEPLSSGNIKGDTNTELEQSNSSIENSDVVVEGISHNKSFNAGSPRKNINNDNYIEESEGPSEQTNLIETVLYCRKCSRRIQDINDTAIKTTQHVEFCSNCGMENQDTSASKSKIDSYSTQNQSHEREVSPRRKGKGLKKTRRGKKFKRKRSKDTHQLNKFENVEKVENIQTVHIHKVENFNTTFKK